MSVNRSRSTSQMSREYLLDRSVDENNSNDRGVSDSRVQYELITEQSVLMIEDGIICRDIGHKMATFHEIQMYRLFNSKIMQIVRWIVYRV